MKTSTSTYNKRGQSKPDLALEIEVRRKIERAVNGMMEDIEREAAKLWTNDKAFDSQDFPRWFIVEMMKRIRGKWYERFRDIAKELAPLMARRADKRTQKQIMLKMRENGFTINMNPTDSQKLIARIFVIDNVELIKTIPQALASQAQAAIMTAWNRGYDLAYLTDSFEKIAGYGRDKAILNARDQMNKITQQMAVANAQSVGISKGRWIHVPGFYSSRKTHIAFDRKIFDLQQGLYDSAVKMFVKPGELPYCNCQFQIVVPGFDE